MPRGHVTGSDWSEENIAHVEKLWKEGLSAGQISGEIPRTRNAILGMMARHRERFPKKTKPGKRPGGWPKGGTAASRAPGWSPTMVATAVRMWGEGACAKEIGMVIGRSEASVRARASQMRDLFPARMKLRTVVTAKATAERPAVKADAQETLPIPSAPDCRMIGLPDRRDSQCAYPMWENGILPTTESPYCGADVAPEGKYCGFHRRLMYQPRAVAAKPERRRAA